MEPWCTVRVSLDLGDGGQTWVWDVPVYQFSSFASDARSIADALDYVKRDIADTFARAYARRLAEQSAE